MGLKQAIIKQGWQTRRDYLERYMTGPMKEIETVADEIYQATGDDTVVGGSQIILGLFNEYVGVHTEVTDSMLSALREEMLRFAEYCTMQEYRFLTALTCRAIIEAVMVEQNIRDMERQAHRDFVDLQINKLRITQPATAVLQ